MKKQEDEIQRKRASHLQEVMHTIAIGFKNLLK